MGARIGHEVEPRPVLLAGILNALGTKGPAEVPARRAYVVKDVLRAAHRAGVKVALPPAHPSTLCPPSGWRPSISIASSACGSSMRCSTPPGPAAAGSTARKEWLRCSGKWASTKVRSWRRASGAEGKERLRRNTDEALARGAFGVPTLFVQGEMFFGFDSFPEIEAYVRGEDPVAQHADLIEKWTKLPASAWRPKAG